MSIGYRSGRADDVAYVIATWRKCLLEGPDCALFRNALKIDDGVIHRGFTNRIVHLLQHSTVRIACDEKDDANIVGFAVYSPTVGHFRYVRERFRGHGIASKLVDVPVLVCTHRSQGHASGKMKQTYNPFLLEAS